MITGRAAAMLCVSAASLWAADLSGVWTGQLPGRNGTFTDIVFKLVQTGNVITGKLYGDFNSYAIIEGKTGEAGQIEFVVVTREQRGNEINDTRFKFTGAVKDGGELELTRERQSVAKVGSGEPVTVRNDTKPVIKLKQLTQ